MKVYFIGAHSTGKTTLARYVAEKYDLPFLNEVARTVLAEKELQLDSLRTNLDIVDSYQTEVFYRQIEEEKKHGSFVSDRSFDNLAYSAQHSRVSHQLVADPIFKTYVESLNKPDVLLFFVRASKATLKNDGVREHLSWDGVVAIDAMIKFLLEINGVRYFQISTDSMQERTRFIDNIIDLFNR
jgi:nicotinamide riboside kinase